MRQRLRHLFVALGLLLTGCVDGPTGSPQGPEAPAQIQQLGRSQDETIEVVPIERFGVSLEAVGSFRPGTPVSITVNVTTSIPTPAADISIFTPELSAEREASGRVALSSRVPAARSYRVAMAAGETVRRSFAIVLPEPGYYRISVAATEGAAGPRIIGGRPIIGAAVAEVWLWIHQDSGRASSRFDPSVFGRGRVQVGGPSLPRQHVPGAPGPMNLSEGCDTWRAVFWNQDLAQYTVLPAGIVAGVIREDQTGSPVAEINVQLNTDGTFTVCAGPEYSYTGTIGLADQYINIQNPSAAGYFGGGPTTGATYDLNVDPAAGRVFMNMRAVSAAAQARFGRPRGAIGVKIQSCPSIDTSCYKLSEDRIYIKSSHVWNGTFSTYAAFVQAHEFGHAYHHTALGGIVNPNCPNPHYLHLPSGLECAYAEGMASFVAVVAFGEFLDEDSFYEFDNYYSGGDGAQIEGAVTATLYDLVDDASSPPSLPI